MDTIKIPDKKNVKMIAHRGLSGIERENTNSAFVAFRFRSYYGIETDIRRTGDGKFVLFHDKTTARVGIDSLTVEQSTFDTLRSLVLTEIDGTRVRSDLRIPTLEEYILINKKYEGRRTRAQGRDDRGRNIQNMRHHRVARLSSERDFHILLL